MRLRGERENKGESLIAQGDNVEQTHPPSIIIDNGDETDEETKKDEDATHAVIENNPTFVDQLITTIWVVLNVGLVVGIVFVNKSIVSDYANSGIAMTFVHMWSTCLALSGAEITGFFKAKTIPYSKVFVLALVNSCAIVFSNLSLQHSPVTIYQIFKVLITPAVALFQSILWPSSVTIGNALSLVLITGGGLVSVATHSEKSITIFSIAVNIAGTILSALFQIMMAKKMKDLKASPNQLLYVQAPLNCIIMLFFLYTMEAESFGRIYADPGFLGVLFVGSLLAPLVNISQTHVIHRTSPLMYSVVSQLKSSTIFLGSIVFLHEHPTTKSIIGLVVLQIGVIWYIITRQRQMTAPSAGGGVPPVPTPLSPISQMKFMLDKQSFYFHLTHPPLDGGAVKKRIWLMSNSRMFVFTVLAIPIFLMVLPMLWWSPSDLPDYSLNATFVPTPRIVHYIWANEHQTSEIPISVFVAIAATYNYVKPDTIYWHHSGTCNFTGWWWKRLKPMVTMNVSPIPATIFGKTPRWIQHKTDLMRLEILNQIGGVYLDTDIIPLKSFDDLFAEGRPVMGFQQGKTRMRNSTICNAVIITPPNATFNRIWYHKYETDFNPACWQCNSVEMPGYLSYKYPNLIRVLPDDQLFSPDWTQCDQLFDDGKVVDLSKHYALHLWGSKCIGNRIIDIDTIMRDNSTFSHIARPFVQPKYLADLDACAENEYRTPRCGALNPSPPSHLDRASRSPLPPRSHNPISSSRLSPAP